MHPAKQVFGKNLANQTHAPVAVDPSAVAYSNACAFLTPVLEGIQAKISKTRYIKPRGVDAKNTARLTGFVIFKHLVTIPDYSIILEMLPRHLFSISLTARLTRTRFVAAS
jgi:hypothetical protein